MVFISFFVHTKSALSQNDGFHALMFGIIRNLNTVLIKLIYLCSLFCLVLRRQLYSLERHRFGSRDHEFPSTTLLR